jgi:hypothetical protein
MFAEFEEKIYESYFNNELDLLSDIYFPLGQVQEGTLGMDSVAYSNDLQLWNNIGYPNLNSSSGENLKIIAEEMERHLSTHVNNIPAFKVNLLFQYKRPEYMKTANAGQWNNWSQKYYRYEIYKKQQKLLEHIEQYLGNKALVLYASPAIHELNNLILIKQNKRIIENSNFQKASKLTGHHYNTYIRSGIVSIACSEPEKIESFDLLEYLNKLSNIKKSDGDKDEENTNSLFIQKFSQDIDVAFLEDVNYRFAYTKLLKEYAFIEEFPLLYSLVKLKIIREITGIQWLITH